MEVPYALARAGQRQAKSAVAAAQEHEHVDEPDKHNKGDLHENGGCQMHQLPP
jgi:hypothetical protein